jgi:hypothetical protein
LILSALFLCALPAAAQDTAKSPWQKLDFLLGKWTPVQGAPAAQGGSTFDRELNGKIIVRRNYSQSDARGRHDDLMVIYADTPGQAPSAIYFDSEGHVIHYMLTFPATDAVIFQSAESEPGPHFRLSYRLDQGLLDGRFEIAPPQGQYKTYLSWTLKKVP